MEVEETRSRRGANNRGNGRGRGRGKGRGRGGSRSVTISESLPTRNGIEPTKSTDKSAKELDNSVVRTRIGSRDKNSTPKNNKQTTPNSKRQRKSNINTNTMEKTFYVGQNDKDYKLDFEPSFQATPIIPKQPFLKAAVANYENLNEFFDFFIDDFIINKIVECTDKKLKAKEKDLRDKGKNITMERTNAIETRALIGAFVVRSNKKE